MSAATTLTPTGDLTIFEVGDLKGKIQSSLAGGGPLTIDLSQAGALDASALQVLIAATVSGSVELAQIPTRAAEQLARLGWIPPKEHRAA